VVPKISQEMLAEMIGTTAAGQLLHEPIQKIGLHPLQWRAASPQLTAERCSPRLACTI
jgi:hypothetical protein